MRQLQAALGLSKDTLIAFSADRGELVAAALAFYALLSLAPLLLIAVAIAGAVLGQAEARDELSGLLERVMGDSAGPIVRHWADQAAAAGGTASVVGLALSLFSASRFAEQLKSALNHVCNVNVKRGSGFRSTLFDYAKQRAFALLLVLLSGPVLLAVFASRALLSEASGMFVPEALHGAVFSDLQLLGSVLLVAGLTALVLRFVPDTRLSSGAILRGALLSSLLFNLGNLAVGLYLGRISLAATYGAAGSAVVVLIWFYFSAQALLYGAELAWLWAERERKSREPQRAANEPAPNSLPAVSAARADGELTDLD